MKREDLKALELSDDVIEKVMALNGKAIESHKSATATAQAELETLKAQLTEAGATIESFKAMKPDELKIAADEWKAKAEKAQADAVTQLAQVKFDHALEAALNGAKAKNAKAVQALLSKEHLALSDDGTITGLSDQLEKIKSENDYLFADAQPAPRVVTKTNNQSILDDPQLSAMRKAAGLSTPKKEI